MGQWLLSKGTTEFHASHSLTAHIVTCSIIIPVFQLLLLLYFIYFILFFFNTLYFCYLLHLMPFLSHARFMLGVRFCLQVCSEMVQLQNEAFFGVC